MTWSADLPEGFESDKIAHLVVHYLQGKSLDLGCGRRKVWPSCLGIDDNSAFYNLTAADMKMDVTDLSIFATGTFDGVFSSHVLEDFPRERAPEVVREWARVLKVGGYLCLYVPSANFYPKMGEHLSNPKHSWDIYPGDIEKVLQEAIVPLHKGGQESAGQSSLVASQGDCGAAVGSRGDEPGPCGLTTVKTVAAYGGGQTAAAPADQFGFELVESEERGEDDEYSIFVVVRKTEGGWSRNLWQRNPGGKKRCLVIRYGAIGDAIMASSILPGLKEQGYHVTLNCKPSTKDVLREDPHVDEWLIQDTDFVPNQALGPYWHSLSKRYDHVVNLCESVETTLLAVPGNLRYHYSDEARRALFGTVNYLDRTHAIAGVPATPKRPRFYPTQDELLDALRERGDKRPAILWTVNGSSDHKVYPHMAVALAWLLVRTPCHVWLTGDAGHGKRIQDAAIDALAKAGIKDHDRLYSMAGKWSVREALTFARVADCVVGPETGILNSVSHERNAKVILLSHSSRTNLTRDWLATTTLEPDRAKAPCYPCHRLHWGWDWCHQDPETKCAVCAASIPPEDVFQAIVGALGLVKKAA